MPGKSIEENLPDGAVVLSVPGLRQAPVLGGGCCAVTAEDAICDELVSWPAIVSATIDPTAQTAMVVLDPEMEDPLADAVEAVRDLGFPAVEILRRA